MKYHSGVRADKLNEILFKSSSDGLNEISFGVQMDELNEGTFKWMS